MRTLIASQLVNYEVPKRVDQLRVAGVLDELSEKFFPYECKFVNLNANTWKEQITELEPHLLFVESVWNGYQKTWYGKVASRISFELVELVNWCKQHQIPTVFWNKEDPIHTFTFMGAAYLFDYVFTTDLDCVPLYKRILGHNRVGVLPFAASPQLFNPIEIYERKDSACFAGSYYGKFKERAADLETITDVLIENYALDIYDRNPYPDDPERNFPERFRSHIVGSLPVDQIDIAYKSYKLGVTLNIVKHSSTMEARRIFELLSCNTLTASNPCLGIKNLFGDLVLYSDDPEHFAKQIKAILGNDNTYNRIRLLALRRVLQEHTYKERLEYLYRKLFDIQPQDTSSKIAVFALVETPKDVEQVQVAFDRQNYHAKELFLFIKPGTSKVLSVSQPLLPLEDFHAALAGDFDYYTCFSPNNYYGKNYLVDLVLATRYATVSVYGKSAHFVWAQNGLHYIDDLGAYRLVDRMKLDRAMFAPHLLEYVSDKLLKDDTGFEHLPCLSIDAYNFAEGFLGESCSDVDDLNIYSGIPMEDMYRISDTLSTAEGNYSTGVILKGQELFDGIQPNSKEFHYSLMPLNQFGFYSVGNRTNKVFVDTVIELSNIDYSNKHTGKDTLYVCINGYVAGNVTFHINYYSESDAFMGSYLVINKACIALPVPAKAKYCKLSITIQGDAYGLLKEVLFGPKVLHPINLSQQVEL